MSTAGAGLQAFKAHYAAVYKDRWPALLQALNAEPSHVALVNPFADPRAVTESLTVQQRAKPYDEIGTDRLKCYIATHAEHKLELDSAQQRTPHTGLAPFYLLDAASLLPPLALAVEPGQSVLDMCAAPGGKSLALAFMLFPSTPATSKLAPPPHLAGAADDDDEDDDNNDADAKTADRSRARQGTTEQQHSMGHSDGDADSQRDPPRAPKDEDNEDEENEEEEASAGDESQDEEDGMRTGPRRTLLTCNEPSSERRARLTTVLMDFLGRERVTSSVIRTRWDASSKQWSLSHRCCFDRILVDAPCSSERHALRDPLEMAKWTPARTKSMAQRQYFLLSHAFKALKHGGRVVYSTCSLSPVENDELVAKVMKKLIKQGMKLKAKKLNFPFGGPTKYGWMVLPDQCAWGPLYLCAMVKD